MEGMDCRESSLLGVVALKMGLSRRFYKVGSSVDCIHGNRKVVLGLHEEFLKLEKIRDLRTYGYNEPLGIGVQGHFSALNLSYTRSSIDMFASSRLPIWVTELDVKSWPNQAGYLDHILRELHSHAAVQGILLWTSRSSQGCFKMCLTDNNFRNLATGDVDDRFRNGLIEKEPYPEPTRKNIEEGFQWLMKGIQPGDSLLFYFSGHGLRQRGLHGDEIDGFDETICPLDFETNGMIFDNFINQTIVKPLIEGVTLHAIVDSCHSGTVLDLPLIYNINAGKWDDNGPQGGNGSKGTSGGKSICFSACEDYQQAADTTAFSPEKNTTGAMTCTFIKAVKAAVINKRTISYREILIQIHEALKRDERIGHGCSGAGLRRVFTRRILQDPLLSSSQEFDANTEFKL